MHAKHSRPQLNWVAATLIAATTLMSGGCAKLYHMLHYNCVASLVNEHHRPFYHSPKTGRIIANEHRANCAVEPPCFGYEPTCWHRWPEECGKCPQEEVIMDVPYSDAHLLQNYVPGEAVPADVANPEPAVPANDPVDAPVNVEDDAALNQTFPFQSDQTVETPVTRPVTDLGLTETDPLQNVEPILDADLEISTRRNPLGRGVDIQTFVKQPPRQEVEEEVFDDDLDAGVAEDIAVAEDFEAQSVDSQVPLEVEAEVVEAAELADLTDDNTEPADLISDDAAEPEADDDVAARDSVAASPVDNLKVSTKVADVPGLKSKAETNGSYKSPFSDLTVSSDVNVLTIDAADGVTTFDLPVEVSNATVSSDAVVAAEPKSVKSKAANVSGTTVAAKPAVPSFKITPVLPPVAPVLTAAPMRIVEEEKKSNAVIRFVSDRPIATERVSRIPDGPTTLKFR